MAAPLIYSDVSNVARFRDLLAGPGVSITDSAISITIGLTSSFGSASFVTVDPEPGVPDSRQIASTGSITLTDGGPQGLLTIDTNQPFFDVALPSAGAVVGHNIEVQGRFDPTRTFWVCNVFDNSPASNITANLAVTVAGIVPPGFRPNVNQHFYGVVSLNGNTAVADFQIDTAGGLTIFVLDNGGAVLTLGTWGVNPLPWQGGGNTGTIWLSS